MGMSCLQSFHQWTDSNKEYALWKFKMRKSPFHDENGAGPSLNQCALFQDEPTRHVWGLVMHAKYEVLSIAQFVASLVLSPFALFIDFGRACVDPLMKFSTVLKDIYRIPMNVIKSALMLVYIPIRIAQKIVSALSIGIGFLLWHGSEWVVRQVKILSTKERTPEMSETVLSKNRNIRDVVYGSLGVTVLAASALFIPVLSIQMIALPIIIGSLYGAINNQMTVRKCPEYYTMGHYYDGTKLEGHAVRTNNLLLKPIITGCYATTFVTKIAGVVLAAAGVIPFVAATLPLTYAAAMVGAVLCISLLTGHIFARMKENKVQKSIEEYARLHGRVLTDEDKKMTWSYYQAKCHQEVLELSEEDLRKRQKIEKYMESNTRYYSDVPVKYLPQWLSNNTRNGVGYAFAGVGTVAITVATVCLRVLIL